MLYYLFGRLNLLLSTLFILSILTFSLGHLFPGDPVHNYSGLLEVSDAEYAYLHKNLKLDEDYLSQYIAFLTRIFDGNFGDSFNSKTPVMTEILHVLPASIELITYALIITITIGIPLGFWAGLKHHKTPDKIIFSSSIIGSSLPSFWLGIIFILYFSLNQHWLPMSGRINFLYEIPEKTGYTLIDVLNSNLSYKQEALIDAIRHLILPTLALSIMPLSFLMATTRESVAQIMQQNFIKAAYTKGLTTWQLIRKHVIQNALLSITPQLGLTFNTLVTGMMVIEVIFSWPGVGHWLVDAIYQRDFPAIQAGLLIVSSFMIMVHIFIDILHALLNPLPKK